MDYYDWVEDQIIKEKPYNWKKHFLFQIPEMFYFGIKLFLIFGVAHLVATSLAKAMIEELPKFCSLMK